MEKALIIFARNPVLGKVKTRLAATIGNEKALDIYKTLLAYTADICSKLACSRFVFYADGISKKDSWNDDWFVKYQQQGEDLGERMQQAFELVFQQGYKKVLIIGTDCFELNSGIIEQAFESLEQYNAVIGPSADGGYYLLGTTIFYPFLFDNKPWSTDGVFVATTNDLSANHISYFTLPVLHDIDTEADWNQYKSKNH